MSGKKKGNIANPDLHSSESPAKDGNELKNRINETAKYSELFEKIDVDSDYDDILATYEKTLDKRTRAAMKKAGGVADEEESVDENVMIEAGEIVSDADSAAQPEVQETAEDKPAKKKRRRTRPRKRKKRLIRAMPEPYFILISLRSDSQPAQLLKRCSRSLRSSAEISSAFSDMSSVFSGSDSRSLSTSFLIHSLSRSRTSGAMCARL